MKYHKLAQTPLGSYSQRDVSGPNHKNYGISKHLIKPKSFRKKLLMFSAFRRDRGFTLPEYYDFVVTKITHRHREIIVDASKYLTREGMLEKCKNGRLYITPKGKEVLFLIGKRDATPLKDGDN